MALRHAGGPAWHLLAPFFVALVAALVFVGKLPLKLLLFYLGASLIAFVVYGWDKSAAQHNRWRTRESTLHLISLLGGWPGALMAQKLLRHKSQKLSFLAVFWLMVLLNCGVLVWTMTTKGAWVLQSLLAGGAG